MRSFWAGVATTIVALFGLWFVVVASVGFPKATECVADDMGGARAVSVQVAALREHGYLRTLTAGDCTAYWPASTRDEHFR